MNQVRPPAVAGTFYPGAPDDLEDLVSALLRGAPAPVDAQSPPKALIVPHAGYVYSGEIAASAYARLWPVRGAITRVVLLGPAHRVPVQGLAGPEAGAFRTPLGDVPVDGKALSSLEGLPQVALGDAFHAAEHSLEVQLPFLQHVLGAFSLVPLVVGDASDAEVAEVLERLWGGEETLVVVSSDLSHYHDYATARHMDAASCDAIVSLEPTALGEASACGRVPVRGLLRVARRHGLEARTLDLRSSGDTAGDRARVVGYGAWAFVPAAGAPRAGASRPRRGRLRMGDLVGLAHEAIEAGVDTGFAPGIDPACLDDRLRAPGACFVTIRSPDGTLRGCIGSLEATRPLAEDVVENAWAAASRDPRMAPIRESELEGLSVEVSVLGPLEPIDATSLGDVVAALEPGLDGLVLEDGRHRGTLLPAVWAQLPEPAAFVGTVWKKAGLPVDHWSGTARAWRYRVKKLGPG